MKYKNTTEWEHLYSPQQVSFKPSEIPFQLQKKGLIHLLHPSHPFHSNDFSSFNNLCVSAMCMCVGTSGHGHEPKTMELCAGPDYSPQIISLWGHAACRLNWPALSLSLFPCFAFSLFSLPWESVGVGPVEGITA